MISLVASFEMYVSLIFSRFSSVSVELFRLIFFDLGERSRYEYATGSDRVSILEDEILLT